MPARVALEGSIIMVSLFGTVAGADLLSIAKEIDDIERKSGKCLNRLADLSEMVATGFMFTLTMNLARHRRVQVFPNPFRSAILAPTPESLGIARLFQILNNNSQIEIRVFTTRPEAKAWLESPPT